MMGHGSWVTPAGSYFKPKRAHGSTAGGTAGRAGSLALLPPQLTASSATPNKLALRCPMAALSNEQATPRNRPALTSAHRISLKLPSL